MAVKEIMKRWILNQDNTGVGIGEIHARAPKSHGLSRQDVVDVLHEAGRMGKYAHHRDDAGNYYDEKGRRANFSDSKHPRSAARAAVLRDNGEA